MRWWAVGSLHTDRACERRAAEVAQWEKAERLIVTTNESQQMSESYPYLALARKHGADYGLVLTYADLLVGRVAAWEIAGQRAVDNLPETVKAEIMETVREQRDKYGR